MKSFFLKIIVFCTPGGKASFTEAESAVYSQYTPPDTYISSISPY